MDLFMGFPASHSFGSSWRTKAQCRGCIQTCRSFEGEAMHIALLVDRCASSLELQKVRREDTRMKREK